LFLIIVLIAAVVIIPRLPFFQPQQDNSGSQQNQPEATVNVVITTQPISRGDEISEGVVTLVAIDQSRLIEGMFTDVESILGQYARFDMDPGTFLTQSMITSFKLGGTGGDYAILIDPGMVAVSIPIDRLSSVAYGVRAGDSVNVILTLLFVDLDPTFQSILPNNVSGVIAPGPALLVNATFDAGEDGQSAEPNLAVDELLQTLTAQIITGGVVSPIGRLELDPTLGQPFYVVPSEAQRPRSVSQTLIQAAKVLYVGTFPLDDAAEEPAATPAPDDQAAQEQQGGNEQQQGQQAQQEEAKLPDVITLIVTPQDAVTLNYLILNGAHLSLALRPANDDTRVQTEAVTLQFLLDQYNIPIPAKLPYGLEPRIDELLAPILQNDITPEPEK
jgi:pilus assembly protein CpaB